MADDLRVYPDCTSRGIVIGWYLQRRKRYLLLFHKWENIARYDSYFYALMMGELFIQKDRLKTNRQTQ